MAHECPDCYCVCHCNGDLDDLVLNYERDVSRCDHCYEDGDAEDLYDGLYEEEDQEPEGMDPETPSANEVSAAQPQQEKEANG